MKKVRRSQEPAVGGGTVPARPLDQRVRLFDVAPTDGRGRDRAGSVREASDQES
jgi:hypothetical protein